jgi:hypothetical protein
LLVEHCPRAASRWCLSTAPRRASRVETQLVDKGIPRKL